MNTALLLPNPVCICLNLLVSIPQIQMPCKSVGRQQLDSVLLSCAIMGDSLGIPRSHHSSTPCSTRVPCLYTHKSACHFYCLLLFLHVTCSPLWCHLVFILCHVALLSFSLSVGCCPFHLLQNQPHEDFAFLFGSGCLGLRRQARMFGNGHLE